MTNVCKTVLFFALVWLCQLMTNAFGYQINVNHQEQGSLDFNSMTLDEGKKLSKPITVKTNDTLTVQLIQFEKEFDHVFLIAKNAKPDQPKLRFPSSYQIDESASSIYFKCRTDLFLGETGQYQLILSFLHSKNSVFSIEIGTVNWKYIHGPDHFFKPHPPVNFVVAEQEHPSSRTLAWAFSIALILPWILLFPSFWKIISQMEFRFFAMSLPFMLCIFAFPVICYLFWTQWNLLQTLPFLLGLFTVTVPISRVLFRRTSQWKKL